MNITIARVNLPQFIPSFYLEHDVWRQLRAKTHKQKSVVVRSLTDTRDRKLRNLLTECGYNRGPQCHLSVCPVCVERTQRSLMIGATKRLVLLSSEYELPVSAFQADLPDRRYELGDLFRLHLPSLNREIQGQYREAGFPLAFSGIRIRLVEDDCTKIGPFWQARLSSVIVGLPKRAVMRAVRNLYPRQSLERLHSIQAGQALKSTIEPEFFREITYKKANGSTGSRIHQLEQRQLRELTVCLARSTMPDRYVLTGCCLNDNGIELNRGVEARLEKLATRR